MDEDKNEKLVRLTRMLEEEITLFQELLKFEKIKNESIVKQDIEKIKELTTNEEEYIETVEKLEEERERLVITLFNEYNIKDEKKLNNLLKVLPDNISIKKRLEDYKDELIKHIKDLKKINEINNKLLKESVEFFNYAVNSLQEVDSFTYTRRGNNSGKEHDISLVINQIA